MRLAGAAPRPENDTLNQKGLTPMFGLRRLPFTEKQREQLELIRRSPSFAEITQRAFRDRLERRARWVKESEATRADLNIRLAATEAVADVAQKKYAEADKAARAAREQRDIAVMQGYAVQVMLSVELNRLEKSLAEDNDPRIGELRVAAERLDDLVRHRSSSWKHVDTDAVGRRLVHGESNLASVSAARQQIAALLEELRILGEGVYPENLLEIFDGHTRTLREIADRFEVRGELDERLLEVDARTKEDRELAATAAAALRAADVTARKR